MYDKNVNNIHLRIHLLCSLDKVVFHFLIICLSLLSKFVFTILLPCVYFLLSGWCGPYSSSLEIPSSWEQRDVPVYMLLLTPLFSFICYICRLCKFTISAVNPVWVPSHCFMSFQSPLITMYVHFYRFTWNFKTRAKHEHCARDTNASTILHCINNMDTDCLINSSICVVYMFPFVISVMHS